MVLFKNRIGEGDDAILITDHLNTNLITKYSLKNICLEI
jgi:hypothetical protein